MFFQDEIEEESPFWGVRQEEQGEGYCLLVTVQVEGVIGFIFDFHCRLWWIWWTCPV